MTKIKHWEDHSRQMVVSHYKQQNDLVTLLKQHQNNNSAEKKGK
jgi:hypothetical protein